MYHLLLLLPCAIYKTAATFVTIESPRSQHFCFCRTYDRHYRPAQNFDSRQIGDEIHYAVPEHWYDVTNSPVDDGLDDLEMIGTSFREPNCEDVFCSLKDSVKWHGPAIEGKIVTTGWDPVTMTPPVEGVGRVGDGDGDGDGESTKKESGDEL